MYIQVMKQLRACPSQSAMELGWELLQRLCQAAPPQDELAEFVRVLVLQMAMELAKRRPEGRSAQILKLKKDTGSFTGKRYSAVEQT